MATAPAAATAAPPTADAQDPLPEGNWFWRRTATLIVIVPAVTLDLFAAYVFWQLDAPLSLLQLVKWNILFAALALLLYMAGANMAEVTKLVQHGKALREGVKFTSFARSTGPEGTAENINTAGTERTPAAAPPSPPPPMFEPAPEPEVDAAPSSRST